MLIAAIVVFCILLLILAFLAPRLSRHPERGGQKVIGVGSRGAGKAPGKLGRWLPEALPVVVQGRLQEREHRPQGPRQATALGAPFNEPLAPAGRSPRARVVIGAHVVEFG